jgi:hypothetical protein
MSRLEFDPITHEPFRQEPVDAPSGTQLPKWNPLDGAAPDGPIVARAEEEEGERSRLIVPMAGL